MFTKTVPQETHFSGVCREAVSFSQNEVCSGVIGRFQEVNNSVGMGEHSAPIEKRLSGQVRGDRLSDSGKLNRAGTHDGLPQDSTIFLDKDRLNDIILDFEPC